MMTPVATPSGTTAWLSVLESRNEQPVRDVFEGLSARSRYFRFLVATPRLPAYAARYLAEVGSRRHVALVATVDGRPAGIARYVLDAEDPRSAEVAFAVVDAQQRRGIGSLLLAALGAVAADAGVETFTYLVHPDNQACVALLGSIGGTFTELDGELVGWAPVPADLLLPQTAYDLVQLVREAAAPPPLTLESRRPRAVAYGTPSPTREIIE